ncbi:TIGR01906 family membrane protein [Chloroflexota bacterium]
MKLLKFVIKGVAALLIPLSLVFLGLRLLLSSGFLSLEYRMPGFPNDQFGFTRRERLHYSNISLNFLLNNDDIDSLSIQTLPNGSPLFNDRELSHLLDVKNVVKPSLVVGYNSWLLLGIIAFVSILAKLKNQLIDGIRLGAWLMLGIIGSIGLFALISFWNFFSIFHSLFFEGESWIFSYSDTLIRLFPLRFWQDAFLIVGLITIGGSLIILFAIKPVRD